MATEPLSVVMTPFRESSIKTVCGILLLGLLIAFGVPSRAADFNWHVRAPELLGLPIPFNGVAYGNGMFVAVGYDGTVALSTNGIVWETNMPPSAVPWTSIAYASGTFLAVGGMAAGGFPTTLVSSVDGRNWTEQAFPDPNAVPTKLSAAKDHFWLCVRSGIDQSRSIFCSSTGTNWFRTAEEFFSNGYGVYYTVAYGAGLYSCVGFDTAYFGAFANYAAPTVIVSADATNWVTIMTGIDPGDLTRDGTGLAYVTYGDRQFVAVGNNNHAYVNGGGKNIWYSKDGTNWSYEITSFPDLKSVQYGDGLYVAVGGYDPLGSPGSILTSLDGTVWSAAPILSTNQMTDVVYGQNTFVVVGAFGQIFQSDPVITLKATTEPGKLLIRAPIDRFCGIEATGVLSEQGVWNPVDQIQITTNPFIWNDPAGVTSTNRFYRAFITP